MSTLDLRVPADDKEFAALPAAVRDEVRMWIHAFRTVPLHRPVHRALEQIGRITRTSYKTARKKYDALRKGGDWRVFVDQRRVSGASRSRVKDPRFQAFLKRLMEENQRSTAQAIEKLYHLWQQRADIPGYEGHPGWPAIPRGWSQRNLYKQSPSKSELHVFRIGMSSASGRLPQVFTTRVGLWPMSHVMIDDMWHDNFVRVTERGAVARILELDALDVFTGYKLAWGTKPRLKARDSDRMEGLKECNTRLLLASLFFSTGYSARGSILIAEHGTAAVRERTRRILHDATEGRISVRDSGIVGAEQAVLASWKGEGKGNPRFKTHLESARNLYHNRLGTVPGQTGPDRDNRPETLSHLLDYQQELLELLCQLPPHRQELIIHPLLDYHSQFCPLLHDVYGAINRRIRHRLEGWHACGFMTTEYRLAPSTEDWLAISDILALPPESQAAVHALASTAPETYSRTRRLSPYEAFHSAEKDLLTIGPEVVCDLLLDDLGRELKVDGSYFVFTDSEISPEPLRYHARVMPLGGTREHELPDGEKYLVFANPFSPDHLFVCGARGQFLGLAERVHRVSRTDEHDLLREFGRKKQRTADRLAALRDRHHDKQDSHRHMVDNNRAVADLDRPVTDDEQARHRALRKLDPSDLTDPEPATVSDPDDQDESWNDLL